MLSVPSTQANRAGNMNVKFFFLFLFCFFLHFEHIAFVHSPIATLFGLGLRSHCICSSGVIDKQEYRISMLNACSIIGSQIVNQMVEGPNTSLA